MIRSILLLIGLLFAAAPKPAIAFTDPCTGLSARLRAVDVAWLKYDLMDRFPAKQEQILRPVPVVEIDDPGLVGPLFQRREKRIVVPRAFLQTQCHMVLLQLVYQSEPDHDFAGIGSTARACIARLHKSLTCLDSAITAFISSLTLAKPPPEISGDAIDLFAMTIFAIRFQLAHEAGHVFIDATIRSPREMRDLDPEVEADILAELSTVADSPIIGAPLYAMASASLIDPGGDGAHDPTVCRLARTRKVVRELGGPTLLLNAFHQKSETIDLRPVAASLRTLDKPLLTGPPRTDCTDDGVSDTRLGAVTIDLDSLYKALGLVRSGTTARLPNPEVADANLAAFTPLTPAGARLRALLRMEIAMKRYDFSGLNSKDIDERDQTEAFQAYLAELENMTSILGSDPGAYFRPSEMAAMMLQKAMTSYVRQPRGSSLRRNSAKLVQDLREIDRIDPIENQLKATMFVLGFSARDGEIAKKLALTRLEIEVGMNMILGDCDEANRLLQAARVAVGAAPSTPMSEAKCREDGRDSGRQFAESGGWIIDLP